MLKLIDRLMRGTISANDTLPAMAVQRLMSRMVKCLARQAAEVKDGILNDRAAGAVASNILKKLAASAGSGPNAKG